MLCKLMKKAGLPDGVVNMVFGTGPKAGEALINHKDVDVIYWHSSCFQQLKDDSMLFDLFRNCYTGDLIYGKHRGRSPHRTSSCKTDQESFFGGWIQSQILHLKDFVFEDT